MIETVFGLARLGHTNRMGIPHALQLALFALKFSDVIEFRSPPPAVQRTLFRALTPITMARLSRHIPAIIRAWDGDTRGRRLVGLPRKRILSTSWSRTENRTGTSTKPDGSRS